MTPGHAVTATSQDEIDRLVQRVLDAPVGVFGVSAAGFPALAGDLWVAAVLEVVHWVLRLLPIAGHTRIDVRIEQRGEHDRSSDWAALVAEVRRHLSEWNPERVGLIAMDSVHLIEKTGHPANGYVDALAYTWGTSRRSASSKTRLAASRLAGPCLHQGNATALRAAWDRYHRGTRLTGEEWEGLVHDPDAAAEGSLPQALLSRLGEACRKNPALWGHFLEQVRRHLDSKAIRLARLGREVEWLATWQPAGVEVSTPLRLAWLTARFERANHLGETGHEIERELEVLEERLLEEAPALVCQADLDRAVLATNRFDFESASLPLERWRSQPRSVPDLLHWARVQSTPGQHAAFRGDYAEADRLFEYALDAFGRLSDAGLAARECAQTAAYRAIAAMDAPGATAGAVRER